MLAMFLFEYKTSFCLKSRAQVVRASAKCSPVLMAPTARSYNCPLKQRHAPCLQVDGLEFVPSPFMHQSNNLSQRPCAFALQIRKATESRSRHQVKTSAVFDYCSTARGNTVSYQAAVIFVITAFDER